MSMPWEGPVSIIVPHKKTDEVVVRNPRTLEQLHMTQDEFKFMVAKIKSGELNPENWTQED
jgi:hypothetical protein